ncbi:MAG: acyl-CoA dehydrogenase family protein [Candidatus Obscuribacterales bacterium]|nr:acyl-CoA dehydrogenase family protein [Candidatus Obscuribacterales bacterium]
MDLRPSEEQCEYRQLAKDFAVNEIAPKAHEYDESGEFPLAIIKQAFEIGLMNVNVPESLGGLALSPFDSCLIVEELAAACPAIALSLTANNLALAPLILHGSDEHKKEFLEPIAGELSFASWLVEPALVCGGMKDVGFNYKKQGADFVITGLRSMVANATRAKWFYVLAFDEVGGSFTAFVVPANVKGISVGERNVALGLKSQDFRQVNFDGVICSDKQVVGEIGLGLELTKRAFDYALPQIASLSVGAGRAAMEHAVQYGKERMTFGVPIANHQAVAFLLADMAKDTEAARLLVFQAAYLIAQGQDASGLASIARAFAAESATKIATDAVQVFGGYGYSREYPVEKLMRDSKVLQVYEAIGSSGKAAIARQLVSAKS